MSPITPLDRIGKLADRFWQALSGWAPLALIFTIAVLVLAGQQGPLPLEGPLIVVQLASLPFVWLVYRTRARSGEYERTPERAYRFAAFNLLNLLIILLAGWWVFPLSGLGRLTTCIWLYIMMMPMLYGHSAEDEHESYGQMWLRDHLNRLLRVNDDS